MPILQFYYAVNGTFQLVRIPASICIWSRCYFDDLCSDFVTMRNFPLTTPPLNLSFAQMSLFGTRRH